MLARHQIRLVIPALVGSAVVLGVAVAPAAVVSFQQGVSPSAGYLADSTTVRSDFADTPQDNDSDFENIVGRVGSAFMRGLWAFDVTELEAIGEFPNVVELNMTTRENLGGQGGPLTVNLYRYDFPFIEPIATWNDPAPGDTTPGGTLGTLLTSVTLDPVPTGQPITFPSTPEFVQAVSDALAAPDNTLRLIAARDVETGTGNHFVRFHDEEYANLAARPELVVTTDTEPPPPDDGGLSIDFGRTGQTVQSGFEAFSRDSSVTDPVSETYASAIGIAGTVAVGLDDSDTTLEFRGIGDSGRTDVTHAIGDVAEDFVFTRGGTLTTTLQDLAAGNYMVTTYHHDTFGTWEPFDLDVTDADGFREVANDIVNTTGGAPGTVGTVVFGIRADGINDVTIDLVSGNIGVLNGLEIATSTIGPPPPPPPSSIVIDDGSQTDVDPNVSLTGSWNWRPESGTNEKPNSYNNTGSRFAFAGGGETATYTPDLPDGGIYQVALWWPTFDWTDNALVQVNHAGGMTEFRVDQTQRSGKWVPLGFFEFDAGTDGSVVFVSDALTNPGTSNVGPVIDAVRFAPEDFVPLVPVGAFASTSHPINALRPATHVIDGSGMLDTDGDGVLETHEANPFGDNINWMTDSLTVDTDPWIAIDLGEAHSLGRVEVFNFNAEAGRTDRGVGQADLYVSLEDSPDVVSPDFSDTSVWQLVAADVMFSEATGTDDYNTPDVLDLGGLQGRWLALDIDSNLGGAFVGLSEVQIFEAAPQGAAIPEPSTFVLLALSALGLFWCRRRR